jgi:NADH-quinone oxidoreductase subunit H
MVSYEVSIGFVIITVLLCAGSLNLSAIVAAQDTRFGMFGWYWLPLLPMFVVFFVSALAETNRPPFDLVEAEQELVGGFHTEYSSFRFALFYLAEFMNTITMSAIIVTLFFGGPAGPAWFGPGWLSGLIWFSLKLFVFLFVFVWIRSTLPRFRYDQLMNIGWKALIPLSLGWLLLLAAINVGRDEGWNMGVVVGVSLLALVVAWGGITAAVDVAHRRRASEQEEALI